MLLEGNLGYLYVGYRLVVTFEKWDFIRKDEALGSNAGRGRGIITSRNEAWVGEQPTKISLRLGKAWWSWSRVHAQVVGKKLVFQVEGDPTIQ